MPIKNWRENRPTILKYYVPEYFTSTNKQSGSRSVTPPTDTDIASARAALALAQATLVQDQDLVTALTTGVIPDTATGTNLVALKQAQTALQTAQTNFNNTQIIAPFDGTVTAVNNTNRRYRRNSHRHYGCRFIPAPADRLY